MSTGAKSLERRVYDLELWRDHQIARDTLTVTQIHEHLAAIRANIGDLEGRSVASRLVSIGVDIGNLAAGQESLKAGQDLLRSDVESLKADVGSLKAGQESLWVGQESLRADVGSLKTEVGSLRSDFELLKADVGVLKTGMTEILTLLRNRW